MFQNILKNIPKEIKVYGSLFIGLAVLFYLYYFSTRFTTVITVKKDDIVKTNGRYNSNLIGAESGEVYKVSSNVLIGTFSSSEILNRIEVGKTYQITGYGKRVHILGLYPVIVSIKQVFSN